MATMLLETRWQRKHALRTNPTRARVDRRGPALKDGDLQSGYRQWDSQHSQLEERTIFAGGFTVLDASLSSSSCAPLVLTFLLSGSSSLSSSDGSLPRFFFPFEAGALAAGGAAVAAEAFEDGAFARVLERVARVVVG